MTVLSTPLRNSEPRILISVQEPKLGNVIYPCIIVKGDLCLLLLPVSPSLIIICLIENNRIFCLIFLSSKAFVTLSCGNLFEQSVQVCLA